METGTLPKKNFNFLDLSLSGVLTLNPNDPRVFSNHQTPKIHHFNDLFREVKLCIQMARI